MLEQEELLYVFISIDLVDSTAFKYKNPKGWPKVFHDFYTISSDYLSSCFVHSEVKIWKRLGDEILFYVSIKDKTEMYRVLEYVDNTLTIVQESLSEDGSIYAKSSVWTADITEYDEDIKIYNNVSLPTGCATTGCARDSLDFIGSDIDTGFRISKYVTKGRIIVCAKMAYTLYKMQCPNECVNISKYLRIVSYERLKGVWNNRAYPIIWYSKDWKNIEFDYDEHLDSTIIQNIKHEKIDSINELDKMLADLGEKKEYDELSNLFTTTLDKVEKQIAQ